MASSAAIEAFDARPRRIAGRNSDGRNQVGHVVGKQCVAGGPPEPHVQPRRYAHLTRYPTLESPRLAADASGLLDCLSTKGVLYYWYETRSHLS